MSANETPPRSMFKNFNEWTSGEGWGENLRVVTRDDASVVQLRCPGCQMWGDIDDDQLHGRVSVDHSDECGYHDTKDWYSEAVRETRRVPDGVRFQADAPSGDQP